MQQRVAAHTKQPLRKRTDLGICIRAHDTHRTVRLERPMKASSAISEINPCPKSLQN